MTSLFLTAALFAQPAAQSATLADQWTVADVTRRPIVELIAEDNPLPLYWAGWKEALPVPPGVPVVGAIPTFAGHVLGFWPSIDKNGNAVYGGTPIGHNLNLHLAKLREQLTRRDAKPGYFGDRVRAAGFICFDFEAWPIAWERVKPNYRALAIEQIRERNPDAARHMTDEQIEELTAREWERSANELFVRSAELVREIIPGTKVGYYNLTVHRKVWPENRRLDHPDAQAWRELNDASMPTVMASDVLFPTIYNFYDNGGNDGRNYVLLNVGEARRLADLATAEDGKERLVIPFVWGLYHQSNKRGRAFTPIDADDAAAHIFAGYEAGADGLALWDSMGIWKQHRQVEFRNFRASVWPVYTDLYAEHYAELIRQTRAEDE